EHVRAGEVRLHRTAAVALSAVVACLTTVDRLREHRKSRGNAGDVQSVGCLLDQQLVAARLRRGLEDAVRVVRQPLATSEDPDEPIHPIVVRRDVVVAYGPVVTEPVQALSPEIIRAEAEGDPAPVVRSPTEHPRSPP